MEHIIYHETDLKTFVAFRQLINRTLVIETVQAVIDGLDGVVDVIRVDVKDDGRVVVYSPFAVCIIDEQNVVVIEKEEIRKIYLSLYSK
ncbi:hypothetical protein EVJ32_10900 [Exiguobacterium sp. SH5S4]|uniref:hypothetical protein n=1 Tax=Exiguobacterium sp. SH5S4 TaxID=2510961 RepID=UPI001038B301|nr:hypothetical protein [Exiguobacterium sp. SH5S4]TCI25299.1 hypothetical protein EVJ32_10900 [Exiguobacterium sp. SH5S4]